MNNVITLNSAEESILWFILKDWQILFARYLYSIPLEELLAHSAKVYDWFSSNSPIHYVSEGKAKVQSLQLGKFP